MIVGTIKQPASQADIALLKKLGYRTETVRPGAMRIWRKKEDGDDCEDNADADGRDKPMR